MKTPADVASERVDVPKVLRGDAKLVKRALEEAVASLAKRAPLDGDQAMLRKELRRMKALASVFDRLSMGDAEGARNRYGMLSEGF